jgi:tetrahydromethanopterin S-methyltransferase subunit B
MNGEHQSQNPDPTSLTTSWVIRELNTLRQIIETRLDAMDRAMELLGEYPTRMDEKIGALKELHKEKFDGIQRQFEEREVRTTQAARDSKDALDAALSAAKEAVEKQNQSSASSITKSEISIEKRIETLMGTIATRSQAVDRMINDLKDRVTSIESSREGALMARMTSMDTGKYAATIIGAIVGVGGLLFGLIAFMRAGP